MHPLNVNATLEEALNVVGMFVFAISGALLAVRKQYDIVGMAVLAEITAIGGGTLRDLILGAVPPAAITDPFSFIAPIAATLLTFFAYERINRIQAAVLVFDAAGLGVFCVVGTVKALAWGMGPISAIALGVITAVGGGIMRDVLAREAPAVMRSDSELYFLPALLGSIIIVVVNSLHLYGAVAAGLAALLVFALRLAALRFHWGAPSPRSRIEANGS
ncbi:MAG: trimeric intracellular cation channel family protein [Chloroflexota bacterium]|nr:trimeric intracellular cation channel family protein [Chloroflexota bacterium]